MPIATDLCGKTYRVHFAPSGATVCDEHGLICDENESRTVAIALAEAYAPGAYVYIGTKEETNEAGEIPPCYKIGMSYDLKRRQQELGIKLIHTIPCANSRFARVAEGMLHYVFDFYCVGGEWFELDEDEISDLMGLKVYDDVIKYYWEQNPLSLEYARYQPGTKRHFAQTMRLIREALGGNKEAKRRALLHLEEIQGWTEEVQERIQSYMESDETEG